MHIKRIPQIISRVLSIFLSLFIFNTFLSDTFAWTNLDGGDHGGSDWTISTNTAVSGVHTNIGTFTVNSGITATIQAYDTVDYGNFEVEANVVDIQGTILGTGKGYQGGINDGDGGEGPGGAPGNSIGGSYGGYGGNYYTGTTYGDFDAPLEIGSGGGSCYCGGDGGDGGGAVKLFGITSVNIDGAVTVNGSTGQSTCGTNAGGGSGGSIYVVSPTISGAGSMSAQGGLGGSGSSVMAGGGGRIYLSYSANTFAGSVSAWGANNGTLLYVDNSTNSLYIKSSQKWIAALSLEGSIHNYDNIYVQDNATWTLDGYATNDSDGVGFVFNVANFYIESGSSITSNSGGYSGSWTDGVVGRGPGGGGTNWGAGGGYGGIGGNNNAGFGVNYGNFKNPVDLGSGGGSGYCNSHGGDGGGSIKIIASGTITVNGPISANGGAATSACGVTAGGGAGGGIMLQASTLTGSANITANGGTGGLSGTGGMGAGGRIFISYSSSNSLSGSITANGYNPGTNLLLNSSTNTLWIKTSQSWDANPAMEGPTHTYNTVYVQNNSELKMKGYYTNNSDGAGITLNVVDMTIDAGSSLNANGYGYGPGINEGQRGSGPGGGSGGGVGVHGGGGGYGGLGGYSNVNDGISYGSASAPVDLGSGGGACYCGGDGGYGGGAIILNASGVLTVNGDISANATAGAAACGFGGGGGSGGSIYLAGNSLTGSGNLAANGANGGNSGGGCGAGGRISLQSLASNTLTGTITAVKGVTCTGGQNGVVSYISVPTSNEGDTSVSGSILPAQTADITTVYSDGNGSSDITEMYIKLINPEGDDIEYYGIAGVDGTNLTPTAVSGSSYVSSIKYDRTNSDPTSDDITVVWHITLNWTWNPSIDIEIATKAKDTSNNSSESTTTGLNLVYTNVLAFTGELSASTSETGVVANNGWVGGAKNVTWSGPKVVYQNTNQYPSDSAFDVQIEDDDGDTAVQTNSSGRNVSIVLKSDSTSDPYDTHTLSIINLTSGASSAGDLTKTIRVDASIPDIVGISGPSNNVWQNTSRKPTLSWTDPASPSDDTFYITTNGTNPSKTNYAYSTTSASYTFPDLGAGTKTILVRPMNSVGTYGTARTYIYKYDNSVVNISDFAGSATADSVTISWLNPVSSSLGFVKVQIQMDTKSFPTSVSSGEKVYEGTAQSTTISGLKANTTYYFTAFTYDGIGNIASGNTLVIKTLVNEKKNESNKDNTKDYIKELDEKSKEFSIVDDVTAKARDDVIIPIVDGRLHLPIGEEVTISLPVDKVKDNHLIDQVLVSINDELYLMSEVDGDYQATFKAPDKLGAYTANLYAIYNDGSVLKQSLDAYIDPYGYVYTVGRGGNELRLNNVKVYLYKVVDGNEVLWDGDDNPYITNSSGEFQFLVEPGRYVLRVNENGYEEYSSGEFVVESVLVNKNIELVRIPIISFTPEVQVSVAFVAVVVVEAFAIQFGLLNGNLWFVFVSIFDRIRKRKPWGFAYDSVTKKGLSRVIIRVFEVETNKLVDTVVSDTIGLFKLALNPGKYRLVISRGGYTFPSKAVVTSSDKANMNVYKGGDININDESKNIMLSIPLDREDVDRASVFRTAIVNAIERFINFVSPIVVVLGTLYSGYIYYTNSSNWNMFVLGAYVFVLLIKLIARVLRVKEYGRVMDRDGRPVQNLRLGLFDSDFNRLQSETMTNELGQYNFVVANKNYYIDTIDSKHKFVDGKAEITMNGKGNVLLVNNDFVVR